MPLPTSVESAETAAPPPAAERPLPMTVRELRRAREFAPGGPLAARLVSAHLPLVYGAALQLSANRIGAAENICNAVFHAFALHWRRLPRRTVIAAWLLRSVLFASRRIHKRRERQPADALLQRLFQLPARLSNALVLRHACGASNSEGARALRVSEKRFNRYSLRAVTRIVRRCRKRAAISDPLSILHSLAVPVPAEIEAQRIASAIRIPTREERRSHLLRGTVRSWSWLSVRQLCRAIFRAAATLVLILLLLAGTTWFLATRGFLQHWGFRHFARQVLKEFPEMGAPARPWPVSDSDRSLVRAARPQTAADLYTISNIWPVKLSFSREQWRAMQPQRVKPVMNISSPDGKLTLRNPNARRSGLAGVLGFDFPWAEARLDFGDTAFERVAVRYRGNGTFLNSLYGPKQSFKVDLNKFQKKQNLGGVHTLNLVNAIPDNSYLHDALAEKVFRELGVPAPRTAYAYLTLDVPGEFNHQALGLYLLIENIDARFAEERFGDKSTPIFKPVTGDLFKDLGSSWSAYADIYDLKTKATDSEKQRIIDLAQLVTHAGDDEFARRLPDLLDIDEFAAFVAGHVLLSSYDGFLANGQNFYIYIDPKTQKIGFIPWDQDHAWGEFGYVGTADEREHASIWEPASYNFHFLRRVMKLGAFRESYRRTLERALAETFTAERLFAEIDQLAAQIRRAVAAESEYRLKRFDQAVSSEWLPGPRDGVAEGPKAPVHQIKRFITNRIPSVRDQLEGKAEGKKLNRKHF